MAVDPVKINTTGMNLDSFNQIYSNKYDAEAGTNVLNISDSSKPAYEDANLELFQVDADNDGQLDDVYRVEKVDENGNRTAMGYVNSSELIEQYAQAQSEAAAASAQAGGGETAGSNQAQGNAQTAGNSQPSGMGNDPRYQPESAMKGDPRYENQTPNGMQGDPRYEREEGYAMAGDPRYQNNEPATTAGAGTVLDNGGVTLNSSQPLQEIPTDLPEIPTDYQRIQNNVNDLPSAGIGKYIS